MWGSVMRVAGCVMRENVKAKTFRFWTLEFGPWTLDFGLWTHRVASYLLSRLWMILNAEALDIIAYLKTAPSKFVSLPEITRRAGGRRRFEESPDWAKNLMTSLVEAGLLEVNARGHYRHRDASAPEKKPQTAAMPPLQVSRKLKAKVVGDDYFPSTYGPKIVGGDYFPES
jgi:hypothetical protein